MDNTKDLVIDFDGMFITSLDIPIPLLLPSVSHTRQVMSLDLLMCYVKRILHIQQILL